MTILITGAAGFIGSHTADRLLAKGHRIIGVDNFSTYYNPQFKEENVASALSNPNYVLERLDCSQEGALLPVFERERVDVIIHLSAQPGVRISIEQPLAAERNNVLATYHIFECARQYNVPQVIFASSSSVYGNQKTVPFSENARVDEPISPYAATKLACEHIAYTYHHLYGLKTIGLRFFNVFGERGRPDMSPYLLVDSILRGSPFRLFGDGSAERDFTYIHDVIDGIEACLALEAGHEIINLGHSSPVPMKQFIATIERHIGKPAHIEYAPSFAWDLPRTFADISKAKRLLGWEPTTSLEDGLSRFIEWFTAYRI